MSPAIQKQQFRNEFGGWIGVVLIGPKGDEQGHAVEPGQTVWLSEPEQILTANAPRRPEDNPFVPQTVRRTNPTTGELEEYSITPLVPCAEDRFVPANARPIPADLYPTGYQQAGAQAAGNIGTNEPTVVTVSGDAVAEKEAKVMADPPPAPPKAAAAAEAAEQPTEEETAADATGAAQEPQGAPVTGSFTQGEEVATPEAPAAPEQPAAPPQAPAPWTPQSDPARVPPEGGAPGSEE